MKLLPGVSSNPGLMYAADHYVQVASQMYQPGNGVGTLDDYIAVMHYAIMSFNNQLVINRFKFD